MSKITCTLFGSPQIRMDGQSLFFPYSRINALLYYILINKTATRDELSSLLWPEESEEAARRNLRNALYQAKKIFGTDIIRAPRKSVLELNGDLDLELDVDSFLADPEGNLALYQGDFLQGFILRNSESYEYWIEKMRNFYREKFISVCRSLVETNLKNHDYRNIEANIRRLIEIDEYDEQNYRLLMQYYLESGRSGKVIETYYEFSRFLRKELNIPPETETRAIYEKALEELHTPVLHIHYDEESVFFFSRWEQIAALEKVVKTFLGGKTSDAAILITGEPGMGKAPILRCLLSELRGEVPILTVRGSISEENMPLRPWYRAYEALRRILEETQSPEAERWKSLASSLFPDSLQSRKKESPPSVPEEMTAAGNLLQVLLSGLCAAAGDRQLILVVENLDCLDDQSLSMFCAILEELPGETKILPAVTAAPGGRPLYDRALMLFKRRFSVHHLDLKPLSPEDCHELISKEVPEKPVPAGLLERIIDKAEGNPFLLNEYIRQLNQGGTVEIISEEIRQFIRATYLCLTPEAEDLANVLACFNVAVPLSYAALVLNRQESTLLGPLNLLLRRGIITEQEHTGKCYLKFTHALIRDCIYTDLSASHRRLLHQSIGNMLEEQLKNVPQSGRLCSMLTYHFENAQNPVKALKYRIMRLDSDLSFSHEIFPILDNDDTLPANPPYLTESKIRDLFDSLMNSIQALSRNSAPPEELEGLLTEFYYMRGRYSILTGDYKSGVVDINYTIERALRSRRTDYAFEGYKQLIYYYIQIGDCAGMEKYLDLALDLSDRTNNHREIGVLLRMKGVYLIMSGKYQEGEQVLRESIDTMNVTSNMAHRYAVNTAASYSYIGKIRMNERRFEEAKVLYTKAISLCPATALLSLAVLYTGAGKASYYLGDKQSARAYFDRAYATAVNFETFWRRPVLDAYSALLSAEEGKYTETKKHLQNARINMIKLNNPSDQGIVHFAETVLRLEADRNPAANAVLNEVLPDSYRHYGQLALNHLNSYLDRCEINRLREIFQVE